MTGKVMPLQVSSERGERPRSAEIPTLVGESDAMQRVRSLAERVAGGTAKALITGESGVGKDLVARYIHALSPRSNRPMVAVNCAGVTESLLESELFGHVKGSFTGAVRDKQGKLQAAHRGTIFLDEVGEMSLRMQALLLRFLENGEIQPVGADGVCSRVDVRIIAATNRDLAELVASGRFREDLMYRLKVVHVHVPPLRDRREDIRPLVEHMLAAGGRLLQIADDAWRALEMYRWPGNIRELHNVVEQLIWTAPTDAVSVGDLPAPIRAAHGGTLSPTRERRRQVADDLYQGLVSGRYNFWDDIHSLFLNRDITRHDMRELVRRGLSTTFGNYRALLKLFGLGEHEYKKFLNFLAAHDCAVDFRAYRRGQPCDALKTAPAASDASRVTAAGR